MAFLTFSVSSLGDWSEKKTWTAPIFFEPTQSQFNQFRIDHTSLVHEICPPAHSILMKHWWIFRVYSMKAQHEENHPRVPYIDIMKFLNFYAHLLVDRSERDAIEKKFKEDRSVKKVLDLEAAFTYNGDTWYCWWFRNSANQLRWRIYHLFTGVLYIPGPRWCRISSINSMIQYIYMHWYWTDLWYVCKNTSRNS